MESWIYGLDGGFSVSDIGLELPVDTLKRSRPLLNDERNLIPFSEERQFMESEGFNNTDMLWNSVISSSCADRDDDDDLIKMLSSNQSVKLTGHGEFKASQSSKSSKRSRTTNLEQCIPVQVHGYTEMKRSHQYSQSSVINFSSEVLVCQVHGCNMNLSTSKNYHKKHKVCDEHSKSALVIVNGTEQRFCQQCSRFHLVVEFDNNKRSCRKRLAEHNECRRKPQNEIHWGAAAMSFHFPEQLSPQIYLCHEIYGNERSCQIEFTMQQSNANTNNGNQHDNKRKQISMETLSGRAGEKCSRAFSLLSAEPSSSGNRSGHVRGNEDFIIKPFGRITSNSVGVHNNEGRFEEESGTILDLQQLSALLQRKWNYS